MKAVELQAFALDGLRMVERNEPRPHGDQVVIRVHAAALNHRDLTVVHGYYDPNMVLPRVPLSDGAGEVVAVGPEVRRFRVGDRVTTMMTRDWITGPLNEETFSAQLGTQLDGVLQEYVMLPERAFVAMPKHLDFVQAATLPIAALTAWSALREAGVGPAHTVLVQGSGGVAIFALQLAKLAGARVFASTTREERAARLQTLGAELVVVSQGDLASLEPILRATGGRGVDVVVDVIGAQNLDSAIGVLRAGGFVALIGLLGYGGPVPDFTLAMLQKTACVKGIATGNRERYEELIRLVEAHQLMPVIDRVFEFGAYRAALEYLSAARHIGKVVIAL